MNYALRFDIYAEYGCAKKREILVFYKKRVYKRMYVIFLVSLHIYQQFTTISNRKHYLYGSL